jgi:hypothetical protein
MNSIRAAFHICIFSICLLFVRSTYSADCPWSRMSGLAMMEFSYDDNFDAFLTAQQVREDLECLKIVLANSYALRLQYPENLILERLTNAIAGAAPTNSKMLSDKIFALHAGWPDLHLSYQVGGGRSNRFETQNPVNVAISEELEPEKIYERATYTYYKPGDLLPTLTQPQADFISYIKNNDANVVLDLRGNGGGDNTFGQALLDSLFTANQHIPQSQKSQVVGPLTFIGFCNTLRISYEVEGVHFCNQIKEMVSGLSFPELVSTSVEVEKIEYQGKRNEAYLSNIFVLIDSGCASACETIVEKIAAHPRATLVGAHTAGALHFSNPLSLKLPNSGIWIKIPTRFESFENDAPEGVGYAPAIETNFIDLDRMNKYGPR